MESTPRYTEKTLRAMRTGASVLSHNKAVLRATACDAEKTVFTGQVVGIGATIDILADSSNLVKKVELSWVLEAEVDW